MSFFESISNTEYHARSEISRSGILEILGKPKPEASTALSLGSKMHAFLFEREIYDSYNIVDTKTTIKEGCITVSEAGKIQDLALALTKIEKVKFLLFSPFALKEKAVFGEIQEVKCRIKPDCLLIDKKQKRVIILDYKTTSSSLAFEDQIAMDCVDYGYDIQAAFYIDVLKSNKVFQEEYQDYDVQFYFVAQEVKSTIVKIFTIDEDSLLLARGHIEFALNKYKEIGAAALSWQQSDLSADILIVSTLGVPEYRVRKARPKLFLNI